jgi:hypothetical protein
MDAKVRGIVHVIEETKTYGQKGFRKRLVVLEQDGRFPNYIPLEFTNDDCDQVDDLNVGDDVEISYELRGRKWQKDAKSEVKFFLNAEARSFKKLGGKSEKSASPKADAAVSGSANDDLAQAAYDEEDIPF